jgi:nicotinate-nucleotide adenylyltransferase
MSLKGQNFYVLRHCNRKTLFRQVAPGRAIIPSFQDSIIPIVSEANYLESGEFLKRIGLFGGTFNPVHLGHVRVIREVKTGFSLDEILIIPSALPPHKKPGNVVNAEDRLEMMRLAFLNDPGFVISDVELNRQGPSYTIDTVRYFTSILSESTKLYLIMGLDAFLETATWYFYKELFLLIPFIVMSRTVKGKDGKILGWKSLGNYLRSRISKGYTFSASQSSYVHEEKKPVFVFDVSPVDISSTAIREHIKKGLSIKRLVPEIIEAFIKTKGLYL